MERFVTPKTYAAWSKSEDIRYNSTSGGAFSEFARVIFEENGVIAGAKYNEDNLVEHVIVDSFEGLEELRQSKYMSSSLGAIYKQVKQELHTGKIVGFCGSPCQVAGLYSYLGREFDNLFTMDFICRGMNSPKAFKSWLEEIENRENSKVKKVWFKYKDGGWKTSPKRTRIDFENGAVVVYQGESNLYMHGYLTSNLYIRPCCGECHFKGIPRKSDVTLADYWGVEKELDDDKGTSMLLINSDKGDCYFDRVKKNMIVHKKDFDAIIAGNPMFSTSAIVPEEGHDFLVDLDNMAFSDAVKKYTPHVPLWRRVASSAKRIVRKCWGTQDERKKFASTI